MMTRDSVATTYISGEDNDRNNALSISSRETYVYACVKKAIGSREFAVACMQKAAEKAREKGVNRVLLDVRNAPNKLSVLDNYQIPYHVLNEVGFTHDLRTAILARPEDNTHEFMETAAVNAGFDFKLFNEEKTAVKWLER